ncbi:PREDICTED: L-type lectin-domain containing receptor kinase IX.1 [Theobroma cacao]|uniref:L-type lectin-domain containing receptor kinase IX.1 n=1 Tax=Theobroma cacao TaxID=3641 RepID=A0AB32WJZ9_THECC|nr:PREDICTED: L-type lectin-domain containing receptor kinase IX.1 [Theobroma cacao]
MELFIRQLTIFTTFLFFLPLIDSVSFNITHFGSNMTDIEYKGDASPSAGAMDLTKNSIYRLGQVICTEPVRLQDFGTKQLTDFTTHFSFTIDTLGPDNLDYGDGIVFFIVPVGFQSPENSTGGGLGLFPNTLIPQLPQQKHQIVVVEFDSFVNSERWDPPYEHVGININSLNSSVYSPWNASFHSGDTADAWISYNASTKSLTVSWSYQVTFNPQENSSLSFHVDLNEVLPMEWVKVGIGAATGFYHEKHILKSWQFSSSLDSKRTKGSKADKIIMIAPLCFGALAVGCIVAFFTIWGKKIGNKQENPEGISLIWIIHDLERGAGPRRFSYKDLISATNNFSDERKLGQGGFGIVYKGHLPELDIDVAVKKFSRGSKQGEREYLAEVMIVSRLRHRNLVQLIGWCHDRGHFLLVYEFMPNGSLDSHLFSHNCTLTWAVRYKICLGLATAMFYLHNDWEQCVVHRDIKAGNVLLDSGFNVKLGDFGLARLVDHELDPRTTCLAGTLGYMAPEYVISGKASSKSDVYSFGVVTLELVTGRRATDTRNDEMGLVEWVWDLYRRGEPLLAVDERLQMEFDEQQAKCMVMVGLWCAHADYTLRPSIRQAIKVLNFEAEMPDLPLQMPVPMYQVPSASPTESFAEPLISNSFSEAGR